MLDVIKQLREETQASFSDCKKAVEKAGGDIEKAREILKTISKEIAIKKSGRQIKEGIVETYVHSNKKIGVMVELGCETDFVARNEQFQELAHNIALQIAAMNPLYVSRDDIPQEVIESQKRIYSEEFRDSNKPVDIIKKIIDGKLESYYSEVCLLDQKYVKNPDVTVKEYLNENIARLGENIIVGRFVRFQI